MINEKIGFIGAGNMGSAIISGLVRSGVAKSENIYVNDLHKSSKLSDGVVFAQKDMLVRDCKYIVLSVKPNIFSEVLGDIKAVSGYENKIFISIAAGITIDFIKSKLGDVKIIRVMPNLPLQVGEGMTVMSHLDNITEDELSSAREIFESSGKVCIFPETYIDKCIAINGSGPAYVFMMIEALADAAVKNGIDRESAYILSAQTLLGSAKMVLESKIHPAKLKDMVCSPSGTTIDAVLSLEKSGFRSSIMQAVESCTQKAISMSKNK